MLDHFSDSLTVITGIVGILSLFAALVANWVRTKKDTNDNKKTLSEVTGSIRVLVSDLQETKSDTKEGNRLLKAVHERMDSVEKYNSRLRINQIRLDERVKFLHSQVKSLKDTQKFKIPEQ